MGDNGQILTAITNLSTGLNTRIDLMSEGLHRRMDKIAEKAGEIPKRPCPDLSGHLTDHKEIQKTWIGELIRGLIASVVIVGTTYIVYRVGW